MKTQYDLEEKHNKNQQLPLIRELVQENKLAEGLEGVYKDFVEEIYAQMILHKRTDVPTLVGLLNRFYGDIQETANKLEQAVQEGHVTYLEDREEFVTLLDLPEGISREMEKYKSPIPLVMEPKEVTKNTDSGYYSEFSKHMHCSTTRTRGDICLDVLNTQNKIPLRINKEVFNHAPSIWKAILREPDDEKRKIKQAQFNKFKDTAVEVVEELLDIGSEIFLTHYYDGRGRFYCRGYHVNYQGYEWQKAVVEFAKEEYIHD